MNPPTPAQDGPTPAQDALMRALRGEAAHVEPVLAIEGLRWQEAGHRAPSLPHSVWELLGHACYWQDRILAAVRGQTVDWPQQPDHGWPAPSPTSAADWDDLCIRFGRGIADAVWLAAQPEGHLDQPLPGWTGATGYSALNCLAAHNSYHIGQIVLVRRALGLWPPVMPPG